MAYSANHDKIAYFANITEEGEKSIRKMMDEENKAAILDQFYDPSRGFNRYDKGFPDAATLQNQIPKRGIVNN